MPNYPQYFQPQYSYQPQPMMIQPNNQPMAQQPAQNQPIQNSGFVLVMSEDEAYRYPVAPGNCVTCKVVNKPIVIEKSMSFSQLDNPKIDRYRLVREEVVDAPKEPEIVETEDSATDELRDEIEALRTEIEGIKKKISNTSTMPSNKPVAKKRGADDDE